MRAELERLLEALEVAGEDDSACRVSEAVNGDEAELRRFLESNELWGGSGSIADQAGASSGARRDVEAALIALGEVQLAAGIINPRTAMWTAAFKQWQADGI